MERLILCGGGHVSLEVAHIAQRAGVSGAERWLDLSTLPPDADLELLAEQYTGTIGLIKAISSFDPAKGARLATYSARCIENAILS